VVVVALASMATSALVVAAVLAVFSLAQQHNLLVPSRRQSAVAAVAQQPEPDKAATAVTLQYSA
jgi:hypothetical protein